VQAFLKQDARDVGRNSEAEVDTASGLQLLGDTTRDDFLDVEFRNAKRAERP
jgi:hypothetical protein